MWENVIERNIQLSILFKNSYYYLKISHINPLHNAYKWKVSSMNVIEFSDCLGLVEFNKAFIIWNNAVISCTTMKYCLVLSFYDIERYWLFDVLPLTIWKLITRWNIHYHINSIIEVLPVRNFFLWTLHANSSQDLTMTQSNYRHIKLSIMYLWKVFRENTHSE